MFYYCRDTHLKTLAIKCRFASRQYTDWFVSLWENIMHANHYETPSSICLVSSRFEGEGENGGNL